MCRLVNYCVVLIIWSLLLGIGLVHAEVLQNEQLLGNSARLLRTIHIRGFGSWVQRYGDLDGDGQADVLLVQIDRTRRVSCLTALTLEGKVLWQEGSPSPRHHFTDGEIPVQVYDWDGDGAADVIYLNERRVTIRSGRTGALMMQTAFSLPRSYSLFLVAENGVGTRVNRILWNGRGHIFLLDEALLPLWGTPAPSSHFPMAVDVDSDGREELLVGPALYSTSGQLLWDRLPRLGGHNDSADAGDLNCDGIPEIGIAPSGRIAVLTVDGTVLWRGIEKHAQHLTIGSFNPRVCSKQVAALDRKSQTIHLYDAHGEVLWSRGDLGELAMMSRMDGWSSGQVGSQLLVFRGKKWPFLLNGRNQITARFPFPPARRKDDNQHFVQHFDLTGDDREEVIVYDHRFIKIYENARDHAGAIMGPRQNLPNPRIYNATFYYGMQ